MPTRLKNIAHAYPDYKPEETGIIILGDAGINFYLNKTDKKLKKNISKFGYTLYCVRGNHEERPENIATYHLENDTNVGNMVWVEEEFPLIRFFCDGGNYIIGQHPVLVIGGAYSVDKWYRLQRAAAAGHSFSGWFESEQLTGREMALIEENVLGKHFDFVFTHTCPLDWEPRDLFLGCIDQTKVDKTMELFLNQLKDTFDWNIWCFGHYHADRIERRNVEQFYYSYDNLNAIWNRWCGNNDFHVDE